MKRPLVPIVMLLVVAVLFIAWRRVASPQDIVAAYESGDLSRVIARISPSPASDADELLRAAHCFRHLGNQTEFFELVEQARQESDATEKVELALALHRIESGQLDDQPATLVDVLQQAGAIDSDARGAVIQGLLARDRMDEAHEMLDAWREQSPNSPQMGYLSAIWENIRGNRQAAESKLIANISAHPRHELSWLALGEVYSRPPDVRFAQAELVYERFVADFPENTDAPLRLSRVRRRLGHAEQALVELSSETEADSELLEKAWVAFDAGKLEQSVALLDEIHLSQPQDVNRLTDTAFRMSLQGQGDTGFELANRATRGATILALSGRRDASAIIFETAEDRTARLRRLQDLNNQQSIEPQRQDLIDESNAIVSPAFAPDYPTLAQVSGAGQEDSFQGAGLPIYAKHCAACHGEQGDGFGPAGGNLNPPPRSFRHEPMRIVSAANGLATDDDLTRTVREGHPGTSMPGFPDLSEADVSSLIEVLRHFMTEGLQEKYEFEHAGQRNDSQRALADWLAARSEPTAAISIPPAISRLTPATIATVAARGLEVFTASGCGQCHPSQAGDPNDQVRLFDSLGRPVHAPDLITDPFHGGAEPAQIYRRLVLGIPGTPHPAVASLSEYDMMALVAHLLAIHQPLRGPSTNYQRGARTHRTAGVAQGGR